MADRINAYDDLFSTVEDRGIKEKKKLPLHQLTEFPDHPYKVQDDEDMKELERSIEQNGVLEPILVRQILRGKYEIISGHRRVHACLSVGITEIDAIVMEMTEEEAVLCMVDSNLRRSKLLPSELARSYKMKYDVIKTMNAKNQSMSLMIRESENSKSAIYRYIKLTELIPDLLNYVDAKRINVKAGVILTKLNQEDQKTLSTYLFYDEKAKINPAKAELMIAQKPLNDGMLEEIFEKKSNPKTVYVIPEDIREMFPRGTSEAEMWVAIRENLQNSSINLKI